jgi:hypothetical protein
MSNRKIVMACPACGGCGVSRVACASAKPDMRTVWYHNKVGQAESTEVRTTFPTICVRCMGKGTFLIDQVVLTERDKMWEGCG